MSSLNVVCPNFRRYAIKVTPGTLLRKVVEEACLKSGYDVDSCVARNQNKIVDLSLPFRLSGLANNSTLELSVVDKPKSQTADIALQLPDGRRNVAALALTSTFHDVLTHFTGVFNENLLSSDNGFPSCVYMNRKYTGPQLAQTSLASIGITGGKCLIRYQKVEMGVAEMAELEEQARIEKERLASMSLDFDKAQKENEERVRLEAERTARFEAELKAKEEEEHRKRQEMAESMEVDQTPHVEDRLPEMPLPSQGNWSFDSPFSSQPAEQAPVQQDRLAHLNSLLQRMDHSLATGATDNMVRAMADSGRVSLDQIATVSEAMDEDDSQPEVQVFSDPCDRKTVIVDKKTTDETAVVPGSSDLPDEFFEVNTDDVRKMQRDLKQQVRAPTQRSLLPRTFVEKKNRDLKLAAYQHSVIRFVIGDIMIQANFNSGEPVSRLFDFASTLFTQKVEFSLLAVLNQPVVSSDSKNLVDAELAPKSTLIVKLRTPSEFKSIVSSNFRTLTHHEADVESAQWLSCNTTFSPFTGNVVEEPAWQGKRSAEVRDTQTHSKPSGSSGPKWFKTK